MMSNTASRRAIGMFVSAGTIGIAHTVRIIQLRVPRDLYSLLNLLLQLFTFICLVKYIWTIYRWTYYKPQPGIQEDDRLPHVSVIMPAYNESAFVRRSIRSVVSSKYPKGKIQLIVVDDGSSDDTWLHISEAANQIEAAQQLLPDPQGAVEVSIVRHAANMGKRQAIVTAFGRARHDIIVSLDSDSVLDPDTLRNLVTPIVLDPTIGGVAGHLLCLNLKPDPSVDRHASATLVPRLLNVLFENCGNVPRSAQSASGFVTILPGAISALRREAILPHLDSVVGQTFLGHPLRHGEDVEMTLKILRDGWRTVYQSNAAVHTLAPETLARAMMMYTRWERSSYTYVFMGFFRLAIAVAFSAAAAKGPETSSPLPLPRDMTLRSPLSGPDTPARTSTSSTSTSTGTSGGVVSSLSSLAAGSCSPPSPEDATFGGRSFSHGAVDLEKGLAGMEGAATWARDTRHADLYPALSLLSTSVFNFVYIWVLLTRLVMLLTRPGTVAVDLAWWCALSALGSLVAVGDAWDDEPATSSLSSPSSPSSSSLPWLPWGANSGRPRPVMEKGRQQSWSSHNGIDLSTKTERLALNLRYAVPSGIFQVLFISWTSIFGLATLTSQNWMTR